MSRARDLGSSINSNLPGKNLVINGGFDFWQRGTTWGGTGYSAADRWYAVLYGSVTATQELSDLPPVGQIKYGAKWTTTANASYGQFYQAFEESLVRTIRGKVVTVSGYIKISGNYSGSQYLNTDYNTSSDALISQSTNNTSTPIGNAVDAANWKYFSIPIIVPANAVGFRIGFIPDQGQPSGAIVRLAAIQMEIGSATQFSRAGGDIQGELSKCHRYYYKSLGGQLAVGFNSTDVIISIQNVMRSTPSVSLTGVVLIDRYGVASYLQSATTLAAPSVYASSNTTGILLSAFTGLTAGIPYIARIDNGSIVLSSEL